MNFNPKKYVNIKTDSDAFAVGLILGVYFVAVASIVSLMTWWTDSNIDYWLTNFKGVETNCPWYLSLIVTLVSGPFCLLFNVISEIAALVL